MHLETEITNLTSQATRDLFHSGSVMHVLAPTLLQQGPKRVI